MLKKMRHVGIVVKDFQRGIDQFKGFGLSCNETLDLKEIGVKIAFLPIGDTLIELLCYTGTDKGHDNVVRSQKGAINHICFEVDNLEVSIKDFEKNGAKLVEGFPRAGAHGRVAFFHPDTTEGVLIELCQV